MKLIPGWKTSLIMIMVPVTNEPEFFNDKT